jgi:dipeptidyl aminopeptidase/acylaminoacyl peptidase
MVRARGTASVAVAACIASAALSLVACGSSRPAPTTSPSVSPPARSVAGTIAFVRVLPIWAPVCDIYAVNADGTGLRALDDGPGFKSHPSWSPDGSKVVYAVLPANDEPGEGADIWVVDADGSGKRRLTQEAVKGSMPVWSPDGGLIAFSRYSRRTRSRDIAVMDAEGCHLRNVTSGVDDDLFPAWASARTILFLRNGALYSVDAHGGEPVRLKGVGTTHGDYALSPDGGRIAVPRSVRDRVVTVDFPDGGRPLTLLRPLSRFITENAHVAADWTPDGAALVVAASSFLGTPYGSLL